MYIDEIIGVCKSLGGSDVDIRVGDKPRIKVEGITTVIPNMLEFVESDFNEFLAREKIVFPDPEGTGAVDASCVFNKLPCRLNIFQEMRGIGIAIRLLNEEVPDLSSLGLPAQINHLKNITNGLITFSGTVGSGKSTSMVSLVDWFNHNLDGKIVTIEQPIEYIMRDARCTVHQREVGRDVKSFALATKQALRQDMNIVMLGELRDKETIQQATILAETGHLVLTSIHAISAPEVPERLASVFPMEARSEIIGRLSHILRAGVHMRLVRTRAGKRVAFPHIMIVNDQIRTNLSNRNYSQIVSTLRSDPFCYSDIESAIDLISNKNCDPKTVLSLMESDSRETVESILGIPKSVIE